MASVDTGNNRSRLPGLAALALVELVAIILAYQVLSSIECRLTDIETACTALKSMTARGLAVLTVTGLFFWLRPASYRTLRELARSRPGHWGWIAAHVFGLILIFAPLPLFGAAEINRNFAPALLFLATGGALAAIAGLLWLTPARNWLAWIRSDRFFLPLVLLAALFVPDLATALQPIWYAASLTTLTFVLVVSVLFAFSADVWADISELVIGFEGFVVQVGHQCSGVEGIALITIFMALYAFLVRGDIRQKRYWLVLFPLALVTSWIFNIVRIAVLILIGARVSPDLALNGFHSYAGWLMFTALSLGVLVAAHRIAWFHVAPAAAPALTPLSHEDTAAYIVPFICMMVTGVIAAAFWRDPAAAYPLRVVIMAAALAYFAPALRRLDRTITPLDIAAGLAVGLCWVATAPDTAGEAAVSPAAAAGFVWVLFRLLGTMLVVPVVEELFFRAYVLARLDRGGQVWRLTALAVSSILFGAMHDRVLAGALAGLVFGLLYLRGGRAAGAISAHITANVVIALWALTTDNWSLI